MNENIYSPYSVISCIKSKNFREYSVLTETLQAYINLDFPGLKEDIIAMLVGEKRKVNVRTFQNDLMSFNTKDDVLTLLIHLGYLGYDSNKREVSIPNTEVRNIFIDAIIISDWNKVTLIFKNADELLEATGEKEENKVKKYIQDAHYETSKLKYDDVNALLYTIKLAYITAMKDYTIIENLSSDEKIVDVLFIPKNNDSTKSAMNIEFKDENVTDTIINKDTITNTEKIINIEKIKTKIKNEKYLESLKKYNGKLLLVNISYNKLTKEHKCSKIDEIELTGN